MPQLALRIQASRTPRDRPEASEALGGLVQALEVGAACELYSGYLVDLDGFRWEVAFNAHPIGGVTLP